MQTNTTEAPLSDEQLVAVEHARNNRISIVCGPPGSGKTKLIAALCKLDKRVLLVTPTGTAAERLAGCAGNKAWVIQKVLFECADETKAKPFRDRMVVVDEAGMVSNAMLLRVFSDIQPRRLVLVGDPKQLPCSDGVPVLNSLIRVDCIPKTVLTKRWRRDGKPPGALDRFLETVGTAEFNWKDQDETFKVVECDTQDECCAKAAASYLANAASPPQILAYTTAVVSQLNTMTENKNAKLVNGNVRVGDRVVCIENAYAPKTKRMLVANGTCGTVFPTCVKYDNKFVDNKFAATRFVPCRAMTVHKSQGNEYDTHGIVVVAQWNGPPPLELMYTAVSRFKTSVTVYIRKTMVRDVFVNAKFSEVVDVDLIESF